MSNDIKDLAESMSKDLKHYREHGNTLSIETAQIKLNMILEAINERNKTAKRHRN